MTGEKTSEPPKNFSIPVANIYIYTVYIYIYMHVNEAVILS